MKTLSATAPGHERAKSEPQWRKMFESLGVLRHMQLVVCPNSTEHLDESLISDFFEDLRHTYEHFSTGISFSHPTSIQDNQIIEAFSCWLANEELKFDLDPRRVTTQNPHGWHDRIFITVGGTLPGHKQSVQRTRRNVHGRLGSLFKRWQAEKKSFDEVFNFEKSWYAKSILEGLEHDRKKAVEMQVVLSRFGPLPRSIARYSSTMSTPLMSGLEWAAKMHFLEKIKSNEEYDSEAIDDKAREIAIAFVESGAMNETPISSAMYASLARKAATGQKRLPDEGMLTDITVVARLLPYCDAMFVDNFCRSLLNDIPQKHKLPYRCRVFSSKTIGEFLEYLRDIQASATPEHVELLKEVYGPKVQDPPKSIYGIGPKPAAP